MPCEAAICAERLTLNGQLRMTPHASYVIPWSSQNLIVASSCPARVDPEPLARGVQDECQAAESAVELVVPGWRRVGRAAVGWRPAALTSRLEERAIERHSPSN